MKYWLTGIISALIVINILLLQRLSEQQKIIDALQSSSEAPKDKSIGAERNESSSSSWLPSLNANHSIDIADTATNQGKTLEKSQRWLALQELRGRDQYEELLYQVQLYLRDYPQSIDGIMLEAEAIYYTQPLNVAIVHYYALRERNLPAESLHEVNKFIEINGSRTIQQLSGDANWHLLARFLEPLIQVDPTNRNYLLSLAKSYGMERQYSLMEDTLAGLPADDRRAIKLREQIYQQREPIHDKQDQMALNREQLTVVQRKDAVELTKIDNKLVASANVANTQLDLLVDTGASITALKSSMRNKIAGNAEFLGFFNVQTAGGTITSPMYRVESFKLGNNRLKNVAVMLLDDDNLGEHDGLLGMNILSNYNFVNTDSSENVYIQPKA